MFTKIAFAALMTLLAVGTPATAEEKNFAAMFANFKAKYGKKYASEAEEASRFQAFIANMAVAQKMQAINPVASFGVNEYADLTAAEFATRHNGRKHFAAVSAKHAADVMPASEKKAAAGKAQDWRPKGAVTPIKNQGQCGSCWSFSTTGGIEGQWFLAGHTLTSLSEQELVSCDTIDHGCQGGLMDNAFDWLMQAHNGSIVTEASYPYVSGEGQVPACSMTGKKFGAQITGHKDIEKNEDAMAAFVFTGGPLSIAVDATSWQTYTGGIMTNCQSVQIDHGVLIVGFDDNNSPPYWIIKNSWGASWGEQGYIRVEKGTNQCLITSYPTTSLVQKGGPTPPPGPTPPGPAGSDFVQKKCTDPKCTDCKEVRLPQGKCISGKERSYKATCATDALIVDAYRTRDCNGAPEETTSNPLNQCSIVFDTVHTEEFVQNDCNPAPPGPPTPPGPPVTTAAPSGGSFIQMNCQNSACNSGCTNHSFALDTCLPVSGGGSAKVECTATALTETVYPTSTSCTGISIPQTMPLNQCLQDNQGTFFENFCTSGVAEQGSLLHIPKRR